MVLAFLGLDTVAGDRYQKATTGQGMTWGKKVESFGREWGTGYVVGKLGDGLGRVAGLKAATLGAPAAAIVSTGAKVLLEQVVEYAMNQPTNSMAPNAPSAPSLSGGMSQGY